MPTAYRAGLLAEAELGHSIEKDEYEKRLDGLRVELLNLQYDSRSADFSTMILVVGDDRPGCIDLLHALHEWMDARYIETHVLYGQWSEEEIERPVFWRYWRRLPPRGRTGLFLGAWPFQLIDGALDKKLGTLELDAGIDHVEHFERLLVQDGTLVLKFWLHLPPAVLKKRLKKAKKKSEWRVEESDWRGLDDYEEGLQMVERLLRRTNTPNSPWTIVESTDHRYRNLAVAQQISHALRLRLESGAPAPEAPTVAAPEPIDEQLVLDRVDLGASLEPKHYDQQLDSLQGRLAELSRKAIDRGFSCVMAFEGWDAAGKGGTIRRLTRALPAQNVRVMRVAAPTDEEKARHYLWRFWRQLPRDGNAVIFDRSWYGRVLVERVEGFAKEEEWRRAYEEINEFESQLCEHGMPVLKFWLHIDPDEQLRRFEARAKTPYKKYKLTEEDFRNREKWPDYSQAVHDMVTRTNTSYAPWKLIAANDKRHARIEVLRTVCERIEAWLDGPGSGKSRKKRKKHKKGRKRQQD